MGTNLSIDGNGVLSSTDTNTTYSIGDGGLTQNNFTDALKSKLDGIAASANAYSLPIASGSSLGGIKVGTNLSIDGNGVLSSTDTNTTYSIGDGELSQNNFTDALKSKLDGIAASANAYSLPIASGSSLGGIKVGTNLSIDGNGVLSSTDTNTTYSIGDGGLTQNNFTDALKSKLDGIAASANAYSLPIASGSSLGGIKVGTNLSIDGNGVLSSTDTNTTYSSGNGINLSGTEFTVSGGDGLTQEASGLKITPSQTTVTSILNSGLVVGRDADNQLKFSTDNQMIFRVNGSDNVVIDNAAMNFGGGYISNGVTIYKTSGTISLRNSIKFYETNGSGYDGYVTLKATILGLKVVMEYLNIH